MQRIVQTIIRLNQAFEAFHRVMTQTNSTEKTVTSALKSIPTPPKPLLREPFQFSLTEQLIWTLTAVSSALEQRIKDKLLATGQIADRTELYIGISGRQGMMPNSGRWPEFQLKVVQIDGGFEYCELSLFDLQALLEGKVSLFTLLASKEHPRCAS